MNDTQRAAGEPGVLPSFRYRYALIASVLVAVLTVTAVLAYRYSMSVAAQAHKQSDRREISTVLLNDSFNGLGQTRQALHDLILRPSEATEAALGSALETLSNALARLSNQQKTETTSESSDIGAALQRDARLIRERSEELVAIRYDPNRWFPANRLIETELSPRNQTIASTIEWIVSNHDLGADHALVEGLYALRKYWRLVIDEARLVIANRFGAHSHDPKVGMAARFGNLKMYADHFSARLERIRHSVARTDDAVLLSSQFTTLRRDFDLWRTAFQRLYEQLRDDNWRADLVYLERRIDPLVVDIQQRLWQLRLQMHTQARAQVDALSRIGQRLIATLFAIFGFMTLIAILGYLSLDRLILHPIRVLTDTLKRQAETPASHLADPPQVRETHDLISAFRQMQELVRERERKLNHMAHHDPLTDLPNRILLRRRLAAAIEATRTHRMLVGLLFIDLDRFKQVNDSHGHATGDEMLVQIGQRLQKVFRQEDLVARQGGDEFAVLLENVHEREEMTRLADKALGVIERPYRIRGKLFYSGASIGIAVAPDNGTDPDRLLQQADTAMYAAKRDADASYRFVSDDLTIGAAEQHALENELREAVKENRLELYFQPVCRAEDGRITSYEALLRWPHDRQGLLHPDMFMDALADTGLCTRTSDWILDHIQLRGPNNGTAVSVNLSARLFHDKDFATRLFDRIDEERLEPDRLVIEITEDTLETDLRAATRVLHELKRRGIKIALDDFGTGKASLSHLRHFPFDYLKIDQSFVAGIGHDRSDEKLIQAVIRLAHALDMQVVGEGIETPSQRDFLIAEGCDYLQGFLVGKPTAI